MFAGGGGKPKGQQVSEDRRNAEIQGGMAHAEVEPGGIRLYYTWTQLSVRAKAIILALIGLVVFAFGWGMRSAEWMGEVATKKYVEQSVHPALVSAAHAESLAQTAIDRNKMQDSTLLLEWKQNERDHLEIKNGQNQIIQMLIEDGRSHARR